MKGKCENCALQNYGFCFCNGTPEEIKGTVSKCDAYYPNTNSITYDSGFLDGYIKGVNQK